MTDSNDVAISRKSNFRIFIEDGVVVIEDEEHKRGGNLLTNGGKWVSWWNDTGGTCRLVFRRFLDEGGSGDGEDAWPFVPEQDPPGNECSIPKELQTGRNPWRGKLASVRELACFEYKVHVHMANGDTFELDPVIIVRT